MDLKLPTIEIASKMMQQKCIIEELATECHEAEYPTR